MKTWLVPWFYCGLGYLSGSATGSFLKIVLHAGNKDWPWVAANLLDLLLSFSIAVGGWVMSAEIVKALKRD